LIGIFAGQYAKLFPENFAEVFEIGKTDGIGDFRDGQPGFHEQLRRPVQADGANLHIGRAAGNRL